MEEISYKMLKETFNEVCKREIKIDPNSQISNPVKVLIIQNHFGGKIHKVEYADPNRKRIICYANAFEVFSCDKRTNSFFRGVTEEWREKKIDQKMPLEDKPKFLPKRAEVVDRSKLLSLPGVALAYKVVSFRLADELYKQKWSEKQHVHFRNPLFSNPIFEQCFYTALDSPCPKMKFACLIVKEGQILVKTYNHFIEPLRHLCQPKCIRMKIPSRTDSLIGACGHAEEFAIWEMIKKGLSLKGCHLYVLGLYPNGLPWLRKEAADFTCLRCAILMWYAGIKTIFVPAQDRWVMINIKDALQKSAEYALCKRQIQ